MTARFLLVGGTGTVGTSLSGELVKKGAIARVGSRDPSHVKGGPGIEPVRLDLGDKGSFDAALAGVDGVFVLSPPGHARQDVFLAPFLEVALSRVKKVVTMTANGVQFDDSLPLRRVELQVAASSVKRVHLRPGWFSQNFNTFWLPSIKAASVIALPAGDARTAFIDARDIAAVAAVALTEDRLDGQELALTGPEALTYAEAAAILTEAAGRPIGYVSVSDADFKAAMVKAGLPADYADVMVGLFGTVRQGFASAVDPAVGRVLGKARSLRDYAKDHAAAWR